MVTPSSRCRCGDLGTHLHAQLGVEVRQRLVHEERSRLAHDRTAHRDALALTTRQLPGLAVEILGQLERLGRLADPLVDLVLGDLGELEGEPDVVVHRHVRVQGVVLEHHRDVAIFRLDVVDDLLTDAHLATRDRLEPGDHPQCGGLAAARRADEHQELAVGDVEAEVVNGVIAVVIDLVDLVENDRCHLAEAPSWLGRGPGATSM